jgi:hypothetical protein
MKRGYRLGIMCVGWNGKKVFVNYTSNLINVAAGLDFSKVYAMLEHAKSTPAGAR